MSICTTLKCAALVAAIGLHVPAHAREDVRTEDTVTVIGTWTPYESGVGPSDFFLRYSAHSYYVGQTGPVSPASSGYTGNGNASPLGCALDGNPIVYSTGNKIEPELDFDVLIRKTGLSSAQLMTLAMQLEMKRVIRRLPGRRLALMDEIRQWDLPLAEETP